MSVLDYAIIGGYFAIVIGLGVTAVMLAFAVRIYKARNTLNIDECTESKW